MKLSILIKSFLASVYWQAGLTLRLLRKQTSQGFVILTYHRVIPKEGAAKGVQPGMYVTPETFAQHAQFLNRYCSVVKLEQIYEKLKSGVSVSSDDGRPICVLTFDDGWQDFYKNAFPVLESYKLPATVFLPTDYIGTNRWFWTDRIGYLFYQKCQSKKSVNNVYNGDNNLLGRLTKLTGDLEDVIESAIELLKRCSEAEIEAVIRELSQLWKINPAPEGRAFLNWEEIRYMLNSGLVSVGSHTASHKILTLLSEKEIVEELERSKATLASLVGVDTNFLCFCYPNGNYNNLVIDAIRQAGYCIALTTEEGWNTINVNRFKLKRVSIHEDMTPSMAMFAARIAGLL